MVLFCFHPCTILFAEHNSPVVLFLPFLVQSIGKKMTEKELSNDPFSTHGRLQHGVDDVLWPFLLCGHLQDSLFREGGVLLTLVRFS